MNKLSFLLVTGLFIAMSFVDTVAGFDEIELFRDDFNGDTLDPCKWTCEDRPMAQTYLKDCPDVYGGMAVFHHHTYNPDDPNNTCLCQSIFSNQSFARGTGLEFKARVRLRSPIGNGLVASFFTYTQKSNPLPPPDLLSDEIDLEFLTNQINNPYPASEGDRVYMSIYNDFNGDWKNPNRHWRTNPVVPPVNMGDRPLLNLTQFNLFKIHWLPGRVEWYWDPEDGKGDVLIYRTTDAMPDEPMFLHFNFWACDYWWPMAYDPDLQPAQRPEDDVVSYYDVDYVIEHLPKIIADLRVMSPFWAEAMKKEAGAGSGGCGCK